MNSFSDSDFLSGLLNQSEQQVMDVDVCELLTPERFEACFGEEFETLDSKNKIDNSADEHVSEACFKFIEEVERRQVEKKNNKINIINHVVIPPPSQQQSHLRKLLSSPRCVTNKVAHKFYGLKKGAATCKDKQEPIISTKKIDDYTNGNDREKQPIQSMERIFPESSSSSSTIIRESNGDQTTDYDLVPKPIYQTVKSLENEPVFNSASSDAALLCGSPLWINSLELSSSQKNAVGVYFKAGHDINRKIQFLRSDEKQIQKEMCLIKKQFDEDMCLLVKRLVGVRNSIEIKKQTLYRISNINFFE